MKTKQHVSVLISIVQGTRDYLLEVGVDDDFVFPFELGPHGPELYVGALGGEDVVHDVNVDVVEDHTTAVRAA